MKNFIPLILAVILGFAAVLAVSRLLAARKLAVEKRISVVATARDISEGEVVTADSVMEKEIPVSAVPAQSILWAAKEIVLGQKALRPIKHNDYVLTADVGRSGSIADVVGEGEWAVALMLPPGGISGVVQPGDEVAVIGTFRIKSRLKSEDLAAQEQEVSKESTLVLFPRARVLRVTGRQDRPAGEGGASEIILALPPQQAQVLVAAQRKGQLTLALRRPNDESAINRLDARMVDESTFDALLNGLESARVPSVPDKREQSKK